MKKLFSVLMFTLALNFLALAGGVGYLFQSGKLNKAKISQIKDVVIGKPGASSTTQPSVTPLGTDNSRANLSNLMANQSGHSAAEQIEFLSRTFDARMLELDQKQRQVTDLQRQVDLANQKLAADRTALEKQTKDLALREQQAQKLQDDTGFQSTLALYNAMPPKQAKTMFMTLSEATVQQYIQAMDTRTAGKIIKEFKTPDETSFIQRVLERIRQSQVSSTDGK
jgi:flagellar motility protein MotE (MotC chaperone)